MEGISPLVRPSLHRARYRMEEGKGREGRGCGPLADGRWQVADRSSPYCHSPRDVTRTPQLCAPYFRASGCVLRAYDESRPLVLKDKRAETIDVRLDRCKADAMRRLCKHINLQEWRLTDGSKVVYPCMLTLLVAKPMPRDNLLCRSCIQP